jgi:hypothetical protein
MKSHFAILVTTAALAACGPAAKPEPAPVPTNGTKVTATAEPVTSTPAPASTAAPAPAPAAAPAATADVVTTSPVTQTSNEITTPNVVTPDKVIASLRPKFNTCYQDGLKKDPKLEGSVTLSAKIEKDGKVSAVTPKNAQGLNPAVIKCLGDQVKAASFAAAGGMNYTTSLDIPVGFSTH